MENNPREEPSIMRATNLQQIGFYILHTLLFMLTAILLLIAYMATRAYQFPGVLLFISPLVVLFQTIPKLPLISNHKRSLGAMAITTLPALASVVLTFLGFDALGDADIAIGFFIALSLISIITSTISYRQFKRIIAQPVPQSVSRPTPGYVAQRPAPARQARRPSSVQSRSWPFYRAKIMLIFKLLFVILFVIPVLMGVIVGIAKVATGSQ